MLLSKEQIFSCQDLQTVIVSVPEWGGDVKVKGMSAIDRIKFEKEQKDLEPSELIIRLVLLACVDDNNDRLFSNDDLKQLEQKSPVALLRVFNEAVKLNILSDEKIEQEAENFPQDHS